MWHNADLCIADESWNNPLPIDPHFLVKRLRQNEALPRCASPGRRTSFEPLTIILAADNENHIGLLDLRKHPARPALCRKCLVAIEYRVDTVAPERVG